MPIKADDYAVFKVVDGCIASIKERSFTPLGVDALQELLTEYIKDANREGSILPPISSPLEEEASENDPLGFVRVAPDSTNLSPKLPKTGGRALP